MVFNNYEAIFFNKLFISQKLSKQELLEQNIPFLNMLQLSQIMFYLQMYLQTMYNIG